MLLNILVMLLTLLFVTTGSISLLLATSAFCDAGCHDRGLVGSLLHVAVMLAAYATDNYLNIA